MTSQGISPHIRFKIVQILANIGDELWACKRVSIHGREFFDLNFVVVEVDSTTRGVLNFLDGDLTRPKTADD